MVRLGSDQQKQRYLPRIASGETITAFALTEPGAGSDAANLALTASREGPDWVLNGTKHFITNSQIAQVFTVFAVTDKSRGPKGISAFIVERGTPGFTVSRVQPTMGLRGSHIAELAFDHCVLPAGTPPR
jgi:acyl-CoA dehydrogenase